MTIINFIEQHWIISILVAIALWIYVQLKNAPTIDEEEILERTTRVKRYVLVTDCADPSVGMYPQHWMVEIPFVVDMSDKELIENFREDIKKLYDDYCEGRCMVEYDFELKFKDDGL